MRARLALHVSEIEVEHREILLKKKPAEMLAVSPKGTVPVLVLPDGTVIDESIDIMYWALKQNDPEGWLVEGAESWLEQLLAFKTHLDNYKYNPTRENVEAKLTACQPFLISVENALKRNDYLLGRAPTVADFGILPFIRQWHFVNTKQLQLWDYSKTVSWLKAFLESTRFAEIMQKVPLWSPGN